MKRSVVFDTPHLRPLLDLARAAEDLGFHRAWTTEYTDRDALIRCALVASATTTLQVGTGIAYSFARHPVMLAAAAADIHEASAGRFSLGIGVATRGMRRRWFGIEDARPVARLRETVALLRALWSGDGAVSFHGEYFNVDIEAVGHAKRLAPLPRLRVFGSGLNTAMVTSAAGCCDGLLLHPLAVSDHGQQALRALLAAAQPAADDLRLIQWAITAVADHRDDARRLARRSLAFYLSTRSYAGHFAGTAWADVPARVSVAFAEHGPRWAALAELVPDAMVDDYCIAGTPSEARERAQSLARSLAGNGVDELVLQVATTGEDADTTRSSLQSALTGLAPR